MTQYTDAKGKPIFSCHYYDECGKSFRETIGGKRLYATHLALEHEAYQSGIDVQEATIRSLMKKQDQAMFLMRRFPECRRTDNGDLFVLWMQYFGEDSITKEKLFLYDASIQGYVFNDSDMPRNSIGRHKLRWLLSELEGVRRTRELLQHRDRKLHKADGSFNEAHICIAPTDEQQVLADARERAIRLNINRI